MGAATASSSSNTVYSQSRDQAPDSTVRVPESVLERRPHAWFAGVPLLNVVGVADKFAAAQAAKFARASEISYPLHVNVHGLKPYLGTVRPAGSNRPVSLLLDRSGQVLEVATAGTTLREHESHTSQLLRRLAAK